ncbi:MAG: hypothetical protein AMQ22_01764 [Candidatus Methanofastidiosum methylothiophilum]|uniref:Uncharacterized protein n=1 Tax=Candidatus Methanofastidiosum methylothiophilum TaxID=1705564 RepID=A0A150IVC6_9EURY|nr:MAG: hypothetical protein AMQ22_01764 [Candidatus Methanofastidiosum methylthiophilus]
MKYKKNYDDFDERVRERSVRKSRRGKVVDSEGFENDDFDIGYRKQKQKDLKRYKTKRSKK